MITLMVQAIHASEMSAYYKGLHGTSQKALIFKLPWRMNHQLTISLLGTICV
jgi:hypothetical protein